MRGHLGISSAKNKLVGMDHQLAQFENGFVRPIHETWDTAGHLVTSGGMRGHSVQQELALFHQLFVAPNASQPDGRP
jgi:hypothetical protein